MEQRHIRDQALRAVSACALAVTLSASAGCWRPIQQAAAVPAARQEEEARPQELDHAVPLSEKYDAVVRLVGMGNVTCTGTLIADDRVLTAHHCVSARDVHGRVLDHDMTPADILVELGGDYLPWGEVKVRAVVAPQCGYTSGEGDIAILVLDRHLIGMPTARIETAPQVGAQIDVYGFGRCALSPGAIHREERSTKAIRATVSGQFESCTAKKVTAIVPGQFGACAAICPGDSGGPAYDRKSGDLIGVLSASVMHGDAQTVDDTIFTRIDGWEQLFSAAQEISLGASPSELPPFGDCHAPSASSASARRPPAR